MKNINQLIGLFIVAVLFASCSTSDNVISGNTIQKRKYNKGFYVSFKNKKQKKLAPKSVVAVNTEKVAKETIQDFLTESENEVANTLIASTDKGFIPLASSKMVEKAAPVSSKKIETLPSAKVEKQLNKVQKRVEKRLKKAEKNSDATAGESSGGGKSQLIALILSIIVGGIGIHRFYLGYIGIGIIQLITFGGFGIWALIDLIRIIMGTLKPKGGEYGSKL